jgi:hypothetical protein
MDKKAFQDKVQGVKRSRSHSEISSYPRSELMKQRGARVQSSETSSISISTMKQMTNPKGAVPQEVVVVEVEQR